MLRPDAGQADHHATIRAIHEKTAFWSLLAFDLTKFGKTLPDQVKAGLISLAGFAVRHGQAVIAGPATPDPLIGINLNVMRGLRGEGQHELS